VAAEPHAEILGDRGDLGQEVDEMAAQALLVEAGIGGQVIAHVIQREALGGARKTEHHVSRQLLLLAIGQGR